MKTIRITRRGIFRGAGDMIPVGTTLEVPDDFNAWPGKWELVTETKGKTLKVATPKPEPEHEPLDEDEKEEIDLSELRAEYERVIGEKPHGRMKAETMRERIADRLAQSEGESD